MDTEGTAPEDRQFTITGLLPQMLYNIYITAVNNMDDEGPAAHITEGTGTPDGNWSGKPKLDERGCIQLGFHLGFFVCCVKRAINFPSRAELTNISC